MACLNASHSLCCHAVVGLTLEGDRFCGRCLRTPCHVGEGWPAPDIRPGDWVRVSRPVVGHTKDGRPIRGTDEWSGLAYAVLKIEGDNALLKTHRNEDGVWIHVDRLGLLKRGGQW